MLPGALNLQQAPPFSVPLRFFLTAPVFALLAALLAIWQGADLYDSRWSPATLAVTHLLTLGVLGMVMLGALMQILPVLAGAPIAHPRALAWIVHVGLTAGTLVLAAGFLSAEPALLKTALAVLGSTLTAFVGAVAWALARVRMTNPTIRALQLAAAALAITIALGLWLAAARSGLLGWPNAALRELHPAWGFLGWSGLLVFAVGCQVVPMFQMTPPYPGWIARWLGPAAFAALAAWSVGIWYGAESTGRALAFALAMLYAAFAVMTLHLQRQRRRKLPDVTVLYWRVGMLCALGAALLWLASSFQPDAPFAVLLGIVVIVGAVLSVITGMLYKIVPFLAWFHLQARAGGAQRVPHIHQYLAESRKRRQFWLHVVALVLLLAAALAPRYFAHAAALAFAASAVQLGVNVLTIALEYRTAGLRLSRPPG